MHRTNDFDPIMIKSGKVYTTAVQILQSIAMLNNISLVKI